MNRDFNARNRASRRFSVRTLIASAVAPALPRHRRGGQLIEALEARQLLSASPVTRPDYIINHGNNLTPAASSSVVGLTVATVRKAYGLDQISFGGVVGDGAGQTIAIVDAYDAPNIVADLHAFDLAMGLSDPTLTVVKQAGTPPSGTTGWALETSLDVEWAHAVAPKANILLVEAASASYTDLMWAVDAARNTAGVSVVSMSWGSTESSGLAGAYDFHFTTPAGHQPITFFASSGDNGAYNSGGTTKAVGYPAVSLNVVAVGGTKLTQSSGTYVSESGWGNGTSSGSLGGGGGGISLYANKPSYQPSVSINGSSTTKENVPDVAWLADPASGAAVYDSYDEGAATPWVQVGGTSLAAPMWAGLMAIVNQGRALIGQTSLDCKTETLPRLYALPSTDFHDITTGNNGFAAGVGYDLVTGLGTPIANKLAIDLTGFTVSSPTPTIGAFTIAPTTVTSGTAATLTASNVTESSGSITGVSFFLETNGVGGYQAGSDTLVSAGAVSGTTYTATAPTAGFAAGTYTYYAVATDATAQTAVASATLAVTAAPVPNPIIGSFVTNPTSVVAGSSTTLTASNVTDSGSTISSVTFYRESDGVAGLSGSDTALGGGSQNGTTWTLSTGTTGFAAGTYTYYAVATDAATVSSAASSATLGVTAAPVPNPIIGSFTLSPTSVLAGTPTTLTASNVTDSGSTISSVTFYRDSDGTAGLNTATDTLVGTGAQNGTTWTISAATTGLAAGSYTFFAVATDTASVSSAASSAVLTVTTQTVTTGLLAGWSVTGQKKFGTQGLQATTVANVTNSTGLTRGAGLATGGSGASNAWGAKNFSSTSATGITANDTVTFGLTVATGKTVSLSSIDLNYRRSSSGPANGLWQYQINGGAFATFATVTSEFSSISSSGGVMPTLSTTGVAGLQNLAAGTVVNIRVVPYGATTTGGTWYVYDKTGNDLAITGTTVSTAIAQLTSAASPATIAGDSSVVPTSGSTETTSTDGGLKTAPVTVDLPATPAKESHHGQAKPDEHHEHKPLVFAATRSSHGSPFSSALISESCFDLDQLKVL